MKVYQAINAVQAELSKAGIAKTRKNLQQGYAFRGIDEVLNALAPILATEKLCILPRVLARETTERQTKSGGVMFSTVLEIEFDFVQSEDGSKHTVRVVGEAMDSGDKSCNKAMSAGYKYAAFLTFCIPLEGMAPDADAATPPEIVSMAPRTKSAQAPATPRAPIEATQEQKAKFLAMVKPVEEAATQYAVKQGWIMPGESLADIGLANIPKTKMKFEAVMADIQKLVDGQGQIPGAEVSSPEVSKPVEVPRDPFADWRELVVPFGKNKGTTFGELEKNNLWWWCCKWQPTEYTSGGKIHPPKASDLALRVILDAVREEYEFTDVQSS